MLAKAMRLKPDLSIANFRRPNIAYIDKSMPEKVYAALRELEIPDLKPE